MATQASSVNEDLIKQRDSCVQNILSSLKDEIENTKFLEHVNVCIGYIETYDITEVDSQLLKFIIPVLARKLKKIFEDNLLLTSTADEEFVINIVKDNLRIVTCFIGILKDILEFILKHVNVDIQQVNCIPITMGQIIFWTFEHCKSSSEYFKDNFKAELLEIFRLTQELHTLYLRLMETCNLPSISKGYLREADIVRDVLVTVCEISEVLSDMNMKSMINNWKGYVALAQKFSFVLEETFDLSKPIKCLESEIIKNLSSLKDLDPENFPSNATRVIGISSFIVKVALKLFEIFKGQLEKVYEELMSVCCSVFSFPPELFLNLDFPTKTVDLITSNILKPFELFIAHLSEDNHIFGKIITSQDPSYDSKPYGILHFLNILLRHIIEFDVSLENNNYRLDMIVKLIFKCIKLCSVELFWYSPSNIFESLIVHVSAAVIKYDSYEAVEIILLQNILQEHCFSALLAIEIWDLLLINSLPNAALETLKILIIKYQKFDFGVNTYRPESVFFKYFIERLYKNLTNKEKMIINGYYQSLVTTTNSCGLCLYESNTQAIDNLYSTTIARIESIGNDNFGIEDLVLIGENFDILSRINFRDIHMDTRRLVNSIAFIWEANHTDFSNNIFKYFISKVCKITRSLILEFNAKQLFMILNQLKVMSSELTFKSQICEILLALSLKNDNCFSQDGDKILSLITNIIYPDLLNSSEAVIRQKTLEVMDSFNQNKKTDVVRDIMKASKGCNDELVNYFQRNEITDKLDKEYFLSLNNFKYRHNCVQWKITTTGHMSKRIKTTMPEPVLVGKNDASRCNVLRPLINKEHEVKTEDERADDVSEAIGNIKSDIKCLMSVLKTQSLSKKNASDLKLLSNQLLSLL